MSDQFCLHDASIGDCYCGLSVADEATLFTLLRQSRGIRQAIGDRVGVAECDAELARIAALA